jgi:hypothetical protein
MKMPPVAAVTGREANRMRIDASETLKLSGQVTSGRGLGTSNIGRNAAQIRDAIGVAVVEGSLNILLNRPVMFANDTAIRMHFDKGEPRLDWPGKLNGIDVWVHRWQSAPLHIVELLSAVHLRSHLKLSNGDKVQIEVRKCDVERIATVGRLTWALFWLGRKSWTYLSRRDGYIFRIQWWCKRFGATQCGTERNCRDLSMALTKTAIKKFPGARQA